MVVPRVERFADPSAFARLVGRYLLRNEAAHNVIFGVLDSLQRDPDRHTGDTYLAAVQGVTGVEGVAVRTPPRPLALSEMANRGAAVAIAQNVYRVQPDLSKILAMPDVSAEFLPAWKELTGVDGRLKTRQQIYALTRVVPPDLSVAGRLRTTRSPDNECLLRWAEGFQVDAFSDSSAEDIQRSRRQMATKLQRGEMHVWDVDGALRSMAAAQGPTPNGIRLSWVYTPPESRRQGYASALVAALSQYLLDRGRTFVFLFADLDFPTSNHIYQAVGFEAVCEMNVYSLGGKSVASRTVS